MRKYIVPESVPENQAFPFEKDRAVTIVAGGCDAKFQEELAGYFEMLAFAFKGYSGYIISGGTTAGIAGMVGSLSNPGGLFTRIGYLPANLPQPEKRHGGYEFFRTSHGNEFSTVDSLQTWADLLDAGIAPQSVKVLGINGGAISAFEFRLAIISGASVGLIEASGRAASALSQDPHWTWNTNLTRLPANAEELRNFLQPDQIS